MGNPDYISAPRIAVIIPNKGRIPLLRMAIASLESQTLQSWEALIVDDGSNDEEVDSIRRMIAAEPRVRLVIRDSEPAGANHCRNLGVQLSRADLVVFLDSDDMLSPSGLEARVNAMAARPDLAFIAFPHEHFWNEPGDLDNPFAIQDKESHLDNLLANWVPWQTAGPTWRRSALETIGAWDETLPCGQDWDYHVRAFVLKLPYEMVSGPRFFHRVPGPHRECVSGAEMDAARVRAREKMAIKAYKLLLEAGLLTDRRRVLIARLLLVVAESWAALGDPESAVASWNTNLSLGLISHRQYQEGLILLRTHQSVILRRTIRLYTFVAWPKQLRFHVKSTVS